MLEFFRALRVPENEFLRLALLAGLLASVAAGVVGSYVVTRRITYIAGGVAHCVLGGIGLAAFASVVWGLKWLQPLHGATAAALLAAVVIGVVSLRAKQREDTVISALWSIGMAAGILFISRTPGYAVDPMSYLFGNILMVSRSDLWLIAGLDVLVVGVSLAFYKRLLAVCFDEEFARLRGVRADAYYLLLLCLTALTVVALVTVVGIVLAIALLALPAAVAGHFSKTLWQMMVLGVALSALISAVGLGLSYGANLPAGSAIVILAGAAYLATALGARLWHWRRAKTASRPGSA
jgi:zinc transport system permease protein